MNTSLLHENLKKVYQLSFFQGGGCYMIAIIMYLQHYILHIICYTVYHSLLIYYIIFTLS